MDTPTPIRIMFAGGGTGGHFYPALRLAEGVRQYAELHAAPEPVIAFFGNPDKIEGKSLQGKETFFPLDVQGFHRGSLGTMISKNLAFTGKLVKSYMRARKNIKEFSPDVVVGTGGYVSGPPLFAAAQRGIPTLIQEQNSYPGVTTRMLAKYANEIHVAYEDAIEYLDEQKTVISGNPVKNFYETTDQASAKRTLTVDVAKYQKFLDEADLTPEQKEDFLQAVWSVVVTFVELGFDVHPLQEVCGKDAECGGKTATDAFDEVCSDEPEQEEKPNGFSP